MSVLLSKLVHDHTHLEVLRENFSVLVHHALEDLGDPDLLADMRAAWKDFRDELVIHMEEEDRLFSSLLPELVEEVIEQHQELRRRLGSLEQLILMSDGELMIQRAELDSELVIFEALWREHSECEWKLYRDTFRLVNGPQSWYQLSEGPLHMM